MGQVDEFEEILASGEARPGFLKKRKCVRIKAPGGLALQIWRGIVMPLFVTPV